MTLHLQPSVRRLEELSRPKGWLLEWRVEPWAIFGWQLLVLDLTVPGRRIGGGTCTFRDDGEARAGETICAMILHALKAG